MASITSIHLCSVVDQVLPSVSAIFARVARSILLSCVLSYYCLYCCCRSCRKSSLSTKEILHLFGYSRVVDERREGRAEPNARCTIQGVVPDQEQLAEPTLCLWPQIGDLSSVLGISRGHQGDVDTHTYTHTAHRSHAVQLRFVEKLKPSLRTVLENNRVLRVVQVRTCRALEL